MAQVMRAMLSGTLSFSPRALRRSASKAGGEDQQLVFLSRRQVHAQAFSTMGAMLTMKWPPAVSPTLLLDRLDAIGAALRDSGQALALLGLGSVGLETGRIDTWSDLDFFAIVEPGSKGRYLHRLDWLAAARPVVWHFQNTVDGHKALMDDGVFRSASSRCAATTTPGWPRETLETTDYALRFTPRAALSQVERMARGQHRALWRGLVPGAGSAWAPPCWCSTASSTPSGPSWPPA
jgi:hypothetical protein